MNALLITYDLHKPGQDYSALIKYLKSAGSWWHHLESTWIVKTSKTASELRNELKAYVDGNDEVLVVNISGDTWASFGLTPRANEWLQQHV